jgi:NTP pyrophosphatase (non-canonical NTP hydrolase)
VTDDSLNALTERLRDFAHERDWEQYHTPKNLTAAIAGEAGELAAVLQWARADEDLARYIDDLEDEVADVLIYVVRLCDVAGIDLLAAASKKINRNEQRFAPAARPAGEAQASPTLRR